MGAKRRAETEYAEGLVASLFPPTLVVRIDTTHAEPARLGAHGARLARWAALGVRVPPGLVITVEGFFETVDALGLRAAYDTLEEALLRGETPSVYAGRVARVLSTGLLPRMLLDPLEDALVDLGLDVGVPLSVEASLPFEGPTDLVPGAVVEHAIDLERAIRGLYAGAFRAEVITLAATRGLPRSPPMAVVVRRHLAPTRATPSTGPFEGAPAELATFAEAIEADLGAPCVVHWALADGRVHVVRAEPLGSDLSAKAR